MKKAELENVKSAIRERHFIWHAGETSVSVIDDEEAASLLGLVPDESSLAETEQATIAANKELRGSSVGAPAAIDWRNNGGDWTTPIKDQSSCGSCVAFAALAAIESRYNIALDNPALDVDLSEAHLFYCGCGNCCSTGWNFPPALDFCRDTGIAREADFPYEPGDQPCNDVAAFLRIQAWAAVLSTADRKATVAEKGPVVAGMAVYGDFFAYTNGVYRRTSDDLRGYHAVCVVGYSDTEECWIAKNSWGDGWGERGWFRIGYGECGIDTQFGFYDTTVRAPEDRCEKYPRELARVLLAAMQNRQLRTCLLYHMCGVGRRHVCHRPHLAVVRATAAILKKCPQYRAKFCGYLTSLCR